MSIKRITISVSDRVAARIKKAVRDKPVSTWVTDLIEGHLEEAELEKQWEEFCRDVNPSNNDRRRAAALYRRLTAQKNRRERAA